MTHPSTPRASHGAQLRGLAAGANDGQPFGRFGRMFHGDDERIDTLSLGLSTELWEAVANDLLTTRES